MGEEGSEFSLRVVRSSSSAKARVGVGSLDETVVSIEVLSSARAVCNAENGVKEIFAYDGGNSGAGAGGGSGCGASVTWAFFAASAAVIITSTAVSIFTAAQITRTPAILSRNTASKQKHSNPHCQNQHCNIYFAPHDLYSALVAFVLVVCPYL